MFKKILLISVITLGFIHCGNDEKVPEAPEPPAPTYSISVEVPPIAGPMILRLNGRHDLTVEENGTYTFDQELESGQLYKVTFHTDFDSCQIEDNEGKVKNKDISNITVSCK